MRIAVTFALALTGGVAFGQETEKTPQALFDLLDADGNGSISVQEYQQGIPRTGWFAAQDADEDRQLTVNEFNEVGDADFDTWDANDDGYLDETEYNTGLFDTWDTDADGYLVGSEWRAAAETGWFGEP